MNKKNILFIVLLAIVIYCQAQEYKSEIIHPRGLIRASELSSLREKVKRYPYDSLLAILYEKVENATIHYDNSSLMVYEKSFLAANTAYIYLLTNDRAFAQISYQYIEKSFTDTLFVFNPYSFGLTRAQALQNMAISYDFCYNDWTEEQRNTIQKKMYELMLSVNNSMGFQGNYTMESNWMGIRWSSVILAALVWDDPLESSHQYPGSRSMPLQWDATFLLRNHIDQNITPGGWNLESISYHSYNWSFIGPSIIALRNHYFKNDKFNLDQFAPNSLQTMHALATSTVSIRYGNVKGITADLSDDDPMFNNHVFTYSQALYSNDQTPYIRWMHEYLLNTGNNDGLRGSSFYSIAYNRDDIEAHNPAEAGWLNYVDTMQGVIVFRNKFKDENDVVATFTTTSKLAHGHQGPDNLTFRILGLDNIWVVGAGRTGQVAGQTNLFPAGNIQNMSHNPREGELIEFGFEKNGSGYANGAGSCLGVIDHTRFFRADYSEESDAIAVFIITDKSLNGRSWRVNTPEFNRVKINSTGYDLIAPNKSSMRFTFFETDIATTTPVIGKVRYGGNTIDHNMGVCYKDSCYKYNRYIDIACKGNIIAIATMQEAGKEQPNVAFDVARKTITVGRKEFLLKNW